MQALVSVIIPVYNVEKYLNKCLDSVLKQSYTNLEIIIVNDCSIDTSGKIIEQYVKIDKRIKYIKNTVNKGVSYSRNQALDVFNGKYVTFIDSDDWVERTYIENLYNKMHNSNLSLAMCALKSYNNKLQQYAKKPNLYFSYNYFLQTQQDIFNKDFFLLHLDQLPMFSASKMYIGDIISSNNIRFPEGKLYEDMLFNIYYLPFITKFGIVYEHEYVYRLQLPTSLSYSNKSNHTDLFHCYLLAEKTLKNYAIYNECKISFYSMKINDIMRIAKKKTTIDTKFFQEASQNLQSIAKDVKLKGKALSLSKCWVLYYVRYKILNCSILLGYIRLKLWKKKI
jgi:glycosyltransferase involved in cell wall biosynthesis